MSHVSGVYKYVVSVAKSISEAAGMLQELIIKNKAVGLINAIREESGLQICLQFEAVKEIENFR